MGIVIDLGATGGGYRPPLAAGDWSVELVKFVSDTSKNKGTPYVEPVFKVVEEGAVDTEGNDFDRPVYGGFKLRFYPTTGAVFRLKEFARELGVELGSEKLELESMAAFAEDLTESFEGGYTLKVENEEYEKDGETRLAARVVAVNGYTVKD